MIKLVIFDADGTLTPQRDGPAGPFDPILLPGVDGKCKELRRAGIILAIASNQAIARRGKPDRRTIGSVHSQLRWTMWAIRATTYRFAVVAGPRYKPGPRMLLELMKHFGVAPDETIFVGDRRADQKSARAAGIRFIWAKTFFGR